jgi:hypothetical protein
MRYGALFYEILFLLLLIPFLFCQEALSETKGDSVEVRLTSSPVVETLPGKIISGNFLVINHTNREELFSEEITLPEGWSLITQEEAFFSLEPDEKEIRIFGISIPQNIPPGLNEIRLSVKRERDHSIVDEKSFNVRVLPLYKLNLSIEEKPDKVVSGQTYSLKVRVFNYGNLKTKVRLTLKTHPEYPLTIEPSTTLDIEVGSSRLFSVHIKTDEKIDRKTYQAIKLTASVEEIREKVSTEQSFSLEIIPRMVGKEDPFHRISSTLTLKGFYENIETPLGGQIEFIGSGTLDEEGEKKISFKFRGPENKRRRTFFDKDEYMLSFSMKNLNVYLGDGYYSLSPLIGPSGAGRGVKVGYDIDGLNIKSFLFTPREDDKNGFSIGGGLNYRLSEMLQAKLNLLRNDLSKDFGDYLVSLGTDIKVEKAFKLELEGAFSQGEREKDISDYAWRVYLSGEPIKNFRFSLKNSHAGPEFPGYLLPGDYWAGGLTFPIYNKISGELSLSKLRENFRSKPGSETTTETDEFFFRGGFSWELPFRANLSLNYQVFDKKDRIEPKDYDFKDHLLRLGLQTNLVFLAMNAYINGYIEGGKSEDRISSTKSHLINSGFSGTFRPSAWQSYTLFFNYGRDYFAESNRKTINLGIAGNWRPSKKLAFDLSYFINERDFEKDTYLRHNLRFRAGYTLPNHHSIQFKGDWIKAKNGERPEVSACLSYTIPLAIPVSKKRSVGTIKGLIYDEENPQKPPLKDVILTASGIPAVTDKNGKFVFPGLKPGEYFLQVERGSIGHDRTTGEKLAAIAVKGGELSNVNVGVVRSGKISGRVLLFVPKKGFITEETISPEDFVPSGGLSDVLVEISRKGEVLRQFTDGRGEFLFEDVRPGLWKVKIYEESIPPFHFLKEKEFDLEIKPSEKRELKIDAFRKPRRILIIEEDENRK